MSRRPSQLAINDPDEKGAVTIRFLGAARTTTGSLHRVRTPQGDFILDCGMYQGHRKEAEAWNRAPPIDIDRLQAVLLSHGHIDHCGMLPNLVKRGYRGPIWCTDATADLLPIMLYDSAHLQESDAERINRRRERKHSGGGRRHGKTSGKPVEPLFTSDDVKRTLSQVKGMPYGTPFEALKDVEVRFVDAGHIIGSAAIHVTVRADGKTVRIGFTGDLGRKDVPILRDPEPLGDVDVYLTESTYGNRDHETAGDLAKRLERVVGPVLQRGGKVLIPAFAVGRTQLILYMLHTLRRDGRIPQSSFYVDSPMATKATRVFEKNRDLYDQEAQEFLTCCGPLFQSGRTSFVGDASESRALNELDGPAVIISASGMCEGGRILHHLKNHAVDPKNTVLFVGYQAEHTLGRRILEGADSMRIFGDEFPVSARIERINGLSAHADRKGLLRYAQRLDHVPEKIFMVHGDEDRVMALRDLFAENGLPGGIAPKPGEWHRLI